MKVARPFLLPPGNEASLHSVPLFKLYTDTSWQKLHSISEYQISAHDFSSCWEQGFAACRSSWSLLLIKQAEVAQTKAIVQNTPVDQQSTKYAFVMEWTCQLLLSYLSYDGIDILTFDWSFKLSGSKSSSLDSQDWNYRPAIMWAQIIF